MSCSRPAVRYQTVQMLNLANKYYKRSQPGRNRCSPMRRSANMRDTETSLMAALQLGQIDYLAIYQSDALQHQLKFIDLPAKINLSDPAQVRVVRAGHRTNRKTVR